MSVWLFASVLVACQQVAPQGDPLQPVPVVPKTTTPATDEPSAIEDNEELVEDEVFRISSEELMAAVDEQKSDSTPPVETQRPTPEEPAVPLKDEAREGAEEIPPDPVPPTVPQTAGWNDVIGKAWPVRLVTTVPNATPPRAILGLPDGREVVVNPGSMVPDMGLVVVAIAPNSAELARIAPAGDHATIETMTLRAQY